MQVVTAVSRNPSRHFVQQVEDGGDVMRGEAPQDILFRAQLSQVKPGRVDVLNPAQFALANHFLESQYCRVILKDVANHQNATVLVRYSDQFLAFGSVQSEWFFDKHVLAPNQTLLR